MIRALVEAALLTNRDAHRDLFEVIVRRRDKTVLWGITRTNPIDRFEIRGGQAPQLAFDNAAVRLRILRQDPEYGIRWAPFDNHTATAGAVRATLTTRDGRVPVPADVWGPPDAAGCRYAVAMISTTEPAFPHWAQPVVVTIRARSGAIDIVGIDRPATLPE
jgi:hypothetical protein